MIKGSYKRFLAILVIVCVFGLLTVNQVCAQEKQTQPENKFVRFIKNLINWPLGVTKKSSEAVGRTTETTVRWTHKTGTSAVETVTGKPEKIKDVVVEPVKGSAETAYTAVKETVEAPIEGTKEAFKPEESK